MAHVVVAGGGVGGCAAALALHQAGAAVAVHEAHPTSTEDLGAFLVLESGAVEVLAQLGVLEAVDQYATQLGNIHREAADGAETISTRPLSGDGAARYRLVRRGHLCQVLQDAVDDNGIELRRGSRVVSAHGELGAVTAVDDRGGQHPADLVVGADGLRSELRRQINTEGAEPRYVGQRVFWGVSPRSDIGMFDDMHARVTAGAVFAYFPTADGTFWFARVTDDELTREQLASPDPSRLVLDRITGTPRKIVESSSEVMVTNTYDLPWVQNWSVGGVLLLGDGAHAASPASGRGAAFALMDGFVLGKAVRDHPSSLGAAVLAFERARRDCAQANIVASARQSLGEEALRDAPQGRPLEPDELATQVSWDRAVPG